LEVVSLAMGYSWVSSILTRKSHLNFTPYFVSQVLKRNSENKGGHGKEEGSRERGKFTNEVHTEIIPVLLCSFKLLINNIVATISARTANQNDPDRNPLHTTGSYPVFLMSTILLRS